MSPDPAFKVIQFVHPGFEYVASKFVGPRRQAAGLMAWKAGRSAHDRKFMLSRGSLFDPASGRDYAVGEIAFWGEWEGPSVFWRIASNGKPEPSLVHAPFRPSTRPTSPVQNTDPLVFGDSFIYSNCMQAHYPALRSLPPGSVVLFGRFSRRGGRPAFGLDTCLVVEEARRLPPIPMEQGTYGVDLIEDAVLRPLYTEDAREDLNVFFGRRRDAGRAGPFSFVPARLRIDDGIPAFARPELSPVGALAGVMTPGNMQGIKSSSHDAASRDAIWAEVVRQVVGQGCGLGYDLQVPPVLDEAGAREASHSLPAALG